jgi:rod shape-determining protein MreC
MTEIRSRVLLAGLTALLAGFALVNMVIDRRALAQGGRDLSWWSGLALDVAVPIQKFVATPFDIARGSWGDYVALLDVRRENGELRARLAETEDENLQLREALLASGRLDRIAQMREEYEVPMLRAELVGQDASTWFRSVLIDRGRNHGVHSGMPLISDMGLVGLVTATSRNAAKGMLLLDRQSAVSAVVQRSRDRGIVRGTGDGLTFEFVGSETDVAPGDVLITSGIGGTFPKGLRIGVVSTVEEPSPQLLREATVDPVVDFGRLEQVFVMLRRSPTMDLLYATEGGELPDPAPADGAKEGS